MASRKVVAASVGAVEALKDQAGLCRWGYALRSVYHRAAAAPRVRELVLSNSKGVASPAATVARRRTAAEEVDVRLRKAHHLVCWGPS